MVGEVAGGLGAGSGGLAEAREAELFKPVREAVALQDLCGAFAGTRLLAAARIAPVVQEEPQKLQVFRTDLATEEEVAAQPAVEVLDSAYRPISKLRRLRVEIGL